MSVASHSFKGANSINPESENARKADRGQDVGDFYGSIGHVNM
jgi:hypothetical protein